jgi:hypothetical protein
MGLNITVNGAPVVLKQQAQKTWKLLMLQPQLQSHEISLVSTNAGFFNQPQNCRVIIAAIPPSLVSECHTVLSAQKSLRLSCGVDNIDHLAFGRVVLICVL